jgi:hypothetical protein
VIVNVQKLSLKFAVSLRSKQSSRGSSILARIRSFIVTAAPTIAEKDGFRDMILVWKKNRRSRTGRPGTWIQRSLMRVEHCKVISMVAVGLQQY